MRVFDIPDSGEPSESTKRQEEFLRAWLFRNVDAHEWLDAMNAMFFVFARELLRSRDPQASITNAISTLEFMRQKVKDQ